MMTLITTCLQILNLRVNVSTVNTRSLKNKKLTIFLFIYATKTFWTNKNYAVKDLNSQYLLVHNHRTKLQHKPWNSSGHVTCRYNLSIMHSFSVKTARKLSQLHKHGTVKYPFSSSRFKMLTTIPAEIQRKLQIIYNFLWSNIK